MIPDNLRSLLMVISLGYKQERLKGESRGGHLLWLLDSLSTLYRIPFVAAVQDYLNCVFRLSSGVEGLEPDAGAGYEQ